MAEVHADIWLGKAEELCEKFKPGRVNCVITDPPFGVDNQSNMAVTAGGKQHARKIANDESPEVALKVFNQVMDVLLPKTSDEADLYIVTAQQVLKEWLQAADNLSRHGFVRSGVLVWQKDGPGMGDLDASWGMAHEFILYLKKGRRPRSAPRRTGVFHVPQVRPNKLIHPHEKPIPLIQEWIRFSTDPGDWIVDPFSGSGSTIRAAKSLGRNSIGCEYDEYNWKQSKKALEDSDGLFG